MAGKKQIRTSFRIAVLARDRYRCAMCGKPGRDRQGGDAHKKYHAKLVAELAPLDAHHITDRNEMPGGGYVVENGISVCADCHLLAEICHRTGAAQPGFAPADLYAKIDSSFEAAYQASLELAPEP